MVYQPSGSNSSHSAGTTVQQHQSLRWSEVR
jgi:hypothetical protein